MELESTLLIFFVTVASIASVLLYTRCLRTGTVRMYNQELTKAGRIWGEILIYIAIALQGICTGIFIAMVLSFWFGAISILIPIIVMWALGTFIAMYYVSRKNPERNN